MQSPIEYPKCTIGGVQYQCRATFNSTYYLADLEEAFPATQLPEDASELQKNRQSQRNMDRALAMASLLLGTISVEGEWTRVCPINDDQSASEQLISAARTLRKQIQPEEFGPLNAAVKVAMDLMSEAMKRAQTAPLPTTEPQPILQ